ncbi:putative 4-amino-4-deoxy-L-arabinose-phosphoundecaprenol flippase subunit ArnE [Yersinia pestis PY-72]|nr:putative 4-amino-4-deoxy-L-arabinose-phosphoundecaprenol flippase subunit ArnE [Yersinia pestis PY-71]EIS78389.1 putative 4-amino-4-deoxy-L-arabinose-phosphoundecaprenol flippase subunit ArnE [Yersinia pestis PY-72]EIT57896.1 putative 4-amino-4-deoxy-L-arabinose-phosphoundecaprenol flippase subunit ArnE [Yersinia pestis PY-103]
MSKTGCAVLGATAGPAVESDIALVGDSCSVTWLGDAVVAAVIAATPAERGLSYAQL